MKVIGWQYNTNEYVGKIWKGEEVDCEIALQSFSNKTGKLEEKRIIKLQGKVLSPLSIESPSLPVGTKFKASITSDPASSVVATTLKGNTVTIKEIKNSGLAKREWTSQKINLEVSFLNYKGKEVPLAKIESTAIGILDKESEKKLRELNLLNSTKRNLTFSVKLLSFRFHQCQYSSQTRNCYLSLATKR